MKASVIVGRFQTHRLTCGHENLIKTAAKNANLLLVCVGNSIVRNTRREPLPFEARKTMLEEFCLKNTKVTELQIVPINDLGNMPLWCEQLDFIINSSVSAYYGDCDITIYGGRDSVVDYYTGKYKTELVGEIFGVNATHERDAVLNLIGTDMNESFRLGMIYASQWRFPCGFPTADIVCCRIKNNNVEMLLCRKPNRTQYQLPGGFFDPNLDQNLEDTAIRELFEETNVVASTIGYLGSYVVDDFRYRKDIDKIVTSVYYIKCFDGCDANPKDDVEEVKWFDLETLIKNTDTIIYPAHKKIIIDAIKNFTHER